MTTALQTNQPKTLTKKVTFIFLGCLILFSFYLGLRRPPIVAMMIRQAHPEINVMVQDGHEEMPYQKTIDYKLRYWLYMWTGIPPTQPVLAEPIVRPS